MVWERKSFFILPGQDIPKPEGGDRVECAICHKHFTALNVDPNKPVICPDCYTFLLKVKKAGII